MAKAPISITISYDYLVLMHPQIGELTREDFLAIAEPGGRERAGHRLAAATLARELVGLATGKVEWISKKMTAHGDYLRVESKLSDEAVGPSTDINFDRINQQVSIRPPGLSRRFIERPLSLLSTPPIGLAKVGAALDFGNGLTEFDYLSTVVNRRYTYVVDIANGHTYSYSVQSESGDAIEMGWQSELLNEAQFQLPAQSVRAYFRNGLASRVIGIRINQVHEPAGITDENEIMSLSADAGVRIVDYREDPKSPRVFRIPELISDVRLAKPKTPDRSKRQKTIRPETGNTAKILIWVNFTLLLVILTAILLRKRTKGSGGSKND